MNPDPIADPVEWFPGEDPDICSIIDHGQKIGAGKIGHVYRVKYDGEYRVIKVSRHQNFERDLTEFPPSKIVLDEIPKTLLGCLTKGPIPEQYLGLDEFSNEAVIAYFLEQTSRKYTLPNFYLIHYDAFTCRKGLIHLMEEAELGTLDQFGYNPLTNKYLRLFDVNGKLTMLVPAHLTREILKQIVIFLIFSGQSLGFVSGDLKAANVFIAGERVKFEHKDELYHIKIDCPFIVKVGDYGKSSITIPLGEAEASCSLSGEIDEGVFQTRIYNRNELSELYLKLTKPPLRVIQLVNGDFGFVLEPNFVFEIFIYNRHSGNPYFRALDFYTLIASMVLLPQFQASFRSPLLQRLWNSIWVDGQGEIVLKRAQQPDRSRTSIQDAIELLKGITLKCNGLELAGRALSETM